MLAKDEPCVMCLLRFVHLQPAGGGRTSRWVAAIPVRRRCFPSVMSVLMRCMPFRHRIINEVYPKFYFRCSQIFFSSFVASKMRDFLGVCFPPLLGADLPCLMTP